MANTNKRATRYFSKIKHSCIESDARGSNFCNRIKYQYDITFSNRNWKNIWLFYCQLLKALDPNSSEVQALILVPSRELAIQIEQVVRNMGSGFKVNAVYGGRPMSKDKIELKHVPAILIGTPGRIADHFANERFSKTI